MKQEREWPAGWTATIGQAVRDHRNVLGWSAERLSEQCTKVGYAIPRNTISNLENGRKAAIPVHEVAVLAQALGVPPLALLFPADLTDTVPGFPGMDGDATLTEVSEWFVGNRVVISGSPDVDRHQEDVVWRLTHWRYYHQVAAAVSDANAQLHRLIEAGAAESEIEVVRDRLERQSIFFVDFRNQLRRNGRSLPSLGRLQKLVEGADPDARAKEHRVRSRRREAERDGQG